jgi:hypothetical protein
VEYSSPYSTTIFAVHKGPNKCRLVQDLLSINEAVFPLHPIVPNCYTLLAQVPSKAQYYSMLDLKDAFFYIPLHPDSQTLFGWRPHQSLTTADTDGIASGLQRQPPHFWGCPNQRLTGLVTPRGHPSPVCWWPTLLWVHWASCFQSNWIPSKLFGLSKLPDLEKKIPTMPS